MPSHGFVVAVVAAHEAEASITSTLRALNGQSRPVDAVIVVTDNCTDHTALMALAAGATIVDADGNGHGRHGALNLALAEVVDMLDDADAVLVLNEDTCLDHDFVARATRLLWTPGAGSPVAAVVGRVIPDLDSWSVAAQCRRNDQLGDLVGPAHTALYRVGALRRVMADRRALRLPDRGATAGVFDPQAVAPDIELAIALQACGYQVVDSVDCRASTTDARSSGRTVFDSHKHHHHGLLDALSSHGLRRPLTRTLITEVRSLLAIAVVPAVVCTIAISAARADMPPWALALLAATVAAWMARRVWSVRSDGWRAMATVSSVMPELARSAVAGTGRLAGSTRWLHDVPSLWGRRSPRQPTWAHGQDRPGGFDPPKAPSRSGRRSRALDTSALNSGGPTASLTLVRVPGPAVVIERIHDDVDDHTTGGGWRNHAVVALAVAMTTIITVGIPLASLAVAWAMLIAAATVSIVVNVTTMVTSSDN